jgi:hypothetical protein
VIYEYDERGGMNRNSRNLMRVNILWRGNGTAFVKYGIVRMKVRT